MKLHVAKEFTDYPYGITRADGEYSGEAFRELLAERFRQAQARGECLEVILNDTRSLSASFLDSAFAVFAKQLLEEKQQFLTEADIHIYGNNVYYKMAAGKIWQYINRHYPEDKQVDMFRAGSPPSVKRSFNNWLRRITDSVIGKNAH